MNGRLFTNLAFALFAGLVTVPWLMATTPWVDSATALADLAVPVVGAYLCLIAPTWRAGLRAGILGSALAFLPAVFGLAADLRLAAAAASVALVRSVWLFRRSAPRALAVELFLGIVGLMLAAWMAGTGPLAAGLGVWTYFLVQSLFFLIPDVQARSTEDARRRDPFDLARERALDLLDGPSVG